MAHPEITDSIPVHELETANRDQSSFEFIRLLPKKGPSTNVPHRHDYYELFIFENGGGSHLIDFQELSISAHSAHLVAPGQVHQLKRSKESVGFAFPFKENFLRNNNENIQFISRFAYMEMETYLPVFHFSNEEFSDILSLVTLIEREAENQKEFNFEMISQYLNIIILNCRRKKSTAHINVPSSDQQLYADFRRQVDLQYKELKKVKDYAHVLRTTERKLNETSKKGSGKSASTIIFERIITEAKRLLVNTEQSVKEICFELNYEDQAHFSNFFKKQSGCSPSQFRELYK